MRHLGHQSLHRSAGARPAAETCSERPPATRRDDIVDHLHGTPVADPYRWLEDASDPAVQGWMRVQDDHARAQLAALPAGPALRARLAELLYVDAVSAPVRRGDRIFYTRRHKDREKAIYYVRQGDDGDEQVLLDPNTLSPDGSISVHGVFPSHDGRLLAYKLSVNNADASTLHLRDLGTGRELADSLYADLFGLDTRDGERRSLFRYYHGRAKLTTWLRSVLQSFSMALAVKRMVISFSVIACCVLM